MSVDTFTFTFFLISLSLNEVIIFFILIYEKYRLDCQQKKRFIGLKPHLPHEQ